MNKHDDARRRWATPSFWRSVRHAWAGLRAAVRTERNLRIHAGATVAVVTSAWWLAISPLEWALLIGTVGLVVCAELVNSAIERLVDLVHPDYHPLAGEVKDVAAAAVVVSAAVAVVVGCLILGPAMLEKMTG